MTKLFKASTLFGFIIAFFFLFQGVATAAPLNYPTDRLFGQDRIETAILLSQEGWDVADTVLLARADNYPDSLVSVPLSKRLNAPILLTNSKRLDDRVLEEIKRLQTTNIILLGGEGALGKEITEALDKEEWLEWERLGGDNRYQTAALVAERLGGNGQVILASGENFPDALAIGPYAGITETPILLVSKSRMPAETDEVLKELNQYLHQDGQEGLKHTYVIGGEAVISNKALEGLKDITRIAGNDRYETAAKVYWFVKEELGDMWGIDPIVLPSSLTDSVETSNSSEGLGDSSKEQAPGDETSAIEASKEENENQTDENATDETLNEEQLNKSLEVGQEIDEEIEQEQILPKVYLVTGENFPDALVAGALATRQNALLFMASKNNLPAHTYSAMGNAFRDGMNVVLIGGEVVLTDKVAGIVAGKVQPPYLLAGLTIVVDPGHGGKDPGAIGYTKSFEKFNTLPTAQKLADLLRAAGANAILTRNSDISPASGIYASLSDQEARVAIAESNRADLFISIHNNAATSTAPYGTETYYSKENKSSNKSFSLAQSVQRQIIKELTVYNRGEKENRGVKEAGFYVVKNTTMPAVLIELGFISNPYEESLLRSSDFQQKAALGIYRGILTYRGY